jgi:hypothetical protein
MGRGLLGRQPRPDLEDRASTQHSINWSSRLNMAHWHSIVMKAFQCDTIVHAIIDALHGIHPKELRPITQADLNVSGLMCGLTATKPL